MSQNNGLSPETLRKAIKQQTEKSLSDLKLIRNLFLFNGSMDFHLTPLQKDELNSVSLGQSAEERSESTGNTQNTIHNRRARLGKAMGAKTLQNAVWLGIASGDLPIDLRDAEKPPFEISSEHSEIILYAAAGEITTTIVEATENTEGEVNALFKEAKELLGAHNRPHLIRRACEERILAPQALNVTQIDTAALVQVHDALQVAQPLLSEAAELIQPNPRP